MISTKVHVLIPLGLHAREAAEFCTLTNRFQCNINIINKGDVINGKSIYGVMKGRIRKDSVIVVQCDGIDDVEAIDEICEFFNKSNA